MLPRAAIAALALVGMAACGGLPGNDDERNKVSSLPPATEGRAYPSTPIRWHIGPACTTDLSRVAASRQELADRCAEGARRDGRDFVAIAISGGGAKAATFGGEAMFMLERLGLLQHADIVSGVSGGSFAATLYALSCDGGDDNCRTAAGRGPRPVWSYEQTMRRLSQGYMPLVAEAVARIFVPLVPVAIPNGRFAGYIDTAYLADAAGRGAGFTFADLNPRRPHLFVNSAIVSGQRFSLDDGEQCASVAQRGADPRSGFLRRRAADEVSHFSFTDFYFRRLCSDITAYPLARAVAASAAFPALVEFASVTDHARRRDGQPTTLLLTDGGANDNQGLIEIYLTLAEVMAGQRRSDGRANQMPGTGAEVLARQDRGLILVINTSLTDATGVNDEPAYSPGALNGVLNIAARTSAAFDRASAANYSLRSRLYQRELDLAGIDFERQRGWTNWRREERIRVQEIGLTVLDDYAFGGPEASQRLQRGLWPVETQVADAQSLYDPDRVRLERQVQRQRSAFETMQDPATRRRLGLSDIHPQCLFEQSKEADASLLSLAQLPEEISACLRHAARWSVALRAQELCADMTAPRPADRRPALNDPRTFAQACRDGQLSLLPDFLDATRPELGHITTPHPLGECRLDMANEGIQQIMQIATRQSRRDASLLPSRDCRVRNRASTAP